MADTDGAQPDTETSDGPASRGEGSIDLHDPEQRGEIEAELRRIEGVLAVRMVPGYERPVDEVHVLVELDKSPKHAVRDLQSVLLARFDLPTDHRVFSVVQVTDETVDGTNRVALGRVTVTTRGAVIEIEVEIVDPDAGTAVGSATGGPSAAGRLRIAAEAALDAVVELTDGALIPELESAEIMDMSGTEVALCVVRPTGSRTSGVVSGSAPVRVDTVDAMVRATLDAMNRAMGIAIE